MSVNTGGADPSRVETAFQSAAGTRALATAASPKTATLNARPTRLSWTKNRRRRPRRNSQKRCKREFWSITTRLKAGEGGLTSPSGTLSHPARKGSTSIQQAVLTLEEG